MWVFVMQFGSDVVGREGKVGINVIPAEIIEIDGGMRLVFDFNDGVVGGQRLRYLKAMFSPIRCLVRARLFCRSHSSILPLTHFNHSWLVFWQNGRWYEFDSRGWAIVVGRVVDMVTEIVALEELVIQSVVFLAVWGRLVGGWIREHVLTHIILLQEEREIINLRESLTFSLILQQPIHFVRTFV